MDRVRFGRALGMGARAAARTALAAVDAATAPSPTPRTTGAQTATRPVTAATAVPAAGPSPESRPTPVATVIPPRPVTARRVMPAARAAAAGVGTPFRKATSALWHEVTGSFFALFALSFAVGAWRMRAIAANTIPNDRFRLCAFSALALLFAYFSISNFMRARRRG